MEPAAVGLATPVVQYVLPFDGSEWRVESRLPRDDLKVGDKVRLSVIPGSEGLTRIERSPFWRGMSVAALLGGAAAIWALLTYWSSVETLLGWRRQRESATSNSLNYLTALTIVAILGLTAWMRFIYMPWLGVSEYGSLITAPDTAMRKAAVRCGPSGENPLNVCETRVLSLAGGSEGAYLAALRENDFESLVRYHAAIARADIPFRIDWATSAPLLLDRDPAILAGLLSAGAVPPPEVAFDLMAVAESRGWTEVLAALRNAQRPGA